MNARTAMDYAAVLARWVLGGFFVYMGLNKALHPEVFLKLVREYDLISIPWLLNSVAATLTILADTTRPTLTGAASLGELTVASVFFTR